MLSRFLLIGTDGCEIVKWENVFEQAYFVMTVPMGYLENNFTSA